MLIREDQCERRLVRHLVVAVGEIRIIEARKVTCRAVKSITTSNYHVWVEFARTLKELVQGGSESQPQSRIRTAGRRRIKIERYNARSIFNVQPVGAIGN